MSDADQMPESDGPGGRADVPGLHRQPLVRALRRLNTVLAGANRVVAARLGLNESDLAILDVLAQDGPQTPSTLARRTRMRATTLASALRRLEEGDWVERRVSATDRRSVSIELTGADRLAAVYRPANERLSALAADMDEADRGRVIALLTEVVALIEDETEVLGEGAP